MGYITAKELRTQSSAIWQRLEAGEEIVVTRYGKPFALLLPTKPAKVETTLRAYRAVRFGHVLEQLQAQARVSGGSKLSQEAVLEEIAAARATTKSASNSTVSNHFHNKDLSSLFGCPGVSS